VPANWTNVPILGSFPNNGNGGVATYDAVISAAGPAYTVALNTGIVVERITLNSSSATLAHTAGTLAANVGIAVDAGTYLLNGGTIRDTAISASGTGSFKLMNISTIRGGSLTGAASGSLQSLGRTVLDGVTLAGDLSIGGSFAELEIRNRGLALNNGRILLGDGGRAGGMRFFSGAQTLSGVGEVILGGPADSTSVLYAVGGGTPTTGSALTIGPGVLIRGPQNGIIGGFTSTDTLVNQGIIRADTGGRTITLRGRWSNAGQLQTANGGTLRLEGNFTTSGLGSFDATGGTIELAGNLDNTGTTLALTPITGSLNLVANATIEGGTVTGSGGAGLFLPIGQHFTLKGVNLGQDFNVGSGSTFHVEGNLTLDGAKVTLASAANSAGLRFIGGGTQTLGGTGEIFLGGAGTFGTNSISTYGYDPVVTHLIFGPGLTIHGDQNADISASGASDTIVNQGTISADTNGKSISLSGHWSNTGTIRALNGGILNLGGTFTRSGLGSFSAAGGKMNLTGTLDNTGATLALSPATGSLTVIGGTIIGGTITGSGGASLLLPENRDGTFDKVTVGTNLAFGSGFDLTVRNGLTLANSTITLGATGSGGDLEFDSGVQTLGGVGEIFLGNSATAVSYNYLYATGGNTEATASKLTIGSGVTIRAPQNGFIRTTFRYDTIVNTGVIRAEAGGRALEITGNFSNAGVLEAVNGGTLNVPAGYTQTAGSTVVNDGRVTVNVGNTINIAGGTLTGAGTIVANVTNAGTISPGNSAGTLTIQGDLTLGVTADLQIEIGGLTQSTQYDLLSEAGSVPLTLAGTLSVRFLNGFLAAPADTFTIVSSNATIGGMFSNVSGGRVYTTDGTGSFAVTRSGSTVRLSNFAVPEPTVGALCPLGFTLLFGRRRR
jgi:hypothetical protein